MLFLFAAYVACVDVNNWATYVASVTGDGAKWNPNSDVLELVILSPMTIDLNQLPARPLLSVKISGEVTIAGYDGRFEKVTFLTGGRVAATAKLSGVLIKFIR